jgi:hypothetical protein
VRQPVADHVVEGGEVVDQRVDVGLGALPDQQGLLRLLLHLRKGLAGVDYTVIASRTDVLVTPTETSFVREPGVRNLYVQDQCPLDPVGHIGMAFDPGVATMISNALDPSSAVPVTCSVGLPF